MKSARYPKKVETEEEKEELFRVYKIKSYFRQLRLKP